MAFETTLGMIAGTLTTVSFIPQVIKVWKTKKTRDISLAMFAILLTGSILWLIYGFMMKDIPLILTNIIIFLLGSIILYFKIMYK